MNKYKNLLTSTTIIPLWAKAVESQSKSPILMDRHACQILQSLGYPLDYYDIKKQNPSQVGCCLRARWIDDQTLSFIHHHKACQVIQLGAGVDDRFRRIGTPDEVKFWYDLDLEEVMNMRKQTIPQAERNEYLSMNLFDTTWMKIMQKNQLPTLVIIEGVMMFLDASSLTDLFFNMANILGECVVLFDSVPALAVGKAKYHDSVKKYNSKVEYTWGFKKEADLKKLSPFIKETQIVRMSDLPQAHKFRLALRLMYKIPYFYRNANQLLIRMNLRKDTHKDIDDSPIV